jgi:hypothetical protein
MRSAQPKQVHRFLKHRLATSCLGIACALYVVYAWSAAIALHSKFSPLAFGDYFVPGLVTTVDAIRNEGVSEVSGLPEAASALAFQRFHEMLYPVRYVSPMIPDALEPGDLYILLPRESEPVPSSLIRQQGAFRLLQVTP